MNKSEICMIFAENGSKMRFLGAKKGQKMRFSVTNQSTSLNCNLLI